MPKSKPAVSRVCSINPHHRDAARVLGVDVAKRTVVICDSRDGSLRTVKNTKADLKAAFEAYGEIDLIVCETTGGHERATCDAAFALGRLVHRSDAARIKAFIQSHGGRAKTDRIDAGWIARYGVERGKDLPRWAPPDPAREELAALVRHRQTLMADRTRAKNRGQAPCAGLIATLVSREIAFLDRQIKAIEARILELIASAPELGGAVRLLRQIKGIGPIAAVTLIALMPELGHLSAKQASALCGLAPHPHESGQTNMRKRMSAGRGGLRPVLFMAALSSARARTAIGDFYRSLVARGKAKRLALAAAARKLVVAANAVLKHAIKTPLQLT